MRHSPKKYSIFVQNSNISYSSLHFATICARQRNWWEIWNINVLPWARKDRILYNKVKIPIFFWINIVILSNTNITFIQISWLKESFPNWSNLARNKSHKILSKISKQHGNSLPMFLKELMMWNRLTMNSSRIYWRISWKNTTSTYSSNWKRKNWQLFIWFILVLCWNN